MLLRDRGYARDLIATDRAARRVVLRALPFDLRQAALRRAARGERAERRAPRVASPLVALARGRVAPAAASTSPDRSSRATGIPSPSEAARARPGSPRPSEIATARAAAPVRPVPDPRLIPRTRERFR